MVAYWLLLLVRRLACLFPGGAVRFCGKTAGAAVYYLDRKHRRIALDNLELAFPEKGETERRRLARLSFAWLGFNLAEHLRLPVRIASGWEGVFSYRGIERLEAARRRSRGVIFIISHFGNWEYLGAVPRLLSLRCAAVGQKIKNPAVDGLIRDMRESVGLDLFSKREVAGQIADYLAGNGAVAILADQRARKMAVEVDFFRRPAPTTAAPAVLALKTSAALLPVFIYPENGGRYRVVFEPEIELPRDLPFKKAAREITARFTAVIEEKVRERPELWFWVHRRWGKREEVTKVS